MRVTILQNNKLCGTQVKKLEIADPDLLADVDVINIEKNNPNCILDLKFEPLNLRVLQSIRRSKHEYNCTSIELTKYM